MEALGFQYCVRWKTYYVDGHERPDNVENRREYIRRYFAYERCCFRWIQLPLSEVEKLEKQDELFARKYGYKYEIDNSTFYEFHIDDHPSFHHRCRHLIFGGHLSDGTCAPNSKEEGQGVMLSSFVSRDFGYGCDLTPSQLDTINQFRENKAYLDEDAAVFVHGNKNKKKLIESPFVRWLHYGQNNDGYWNYHHMIVQLGDIIDCLRVLYRDKYEFVFFFDHSSGHDHLRPGPISTSGQVEYW